MLRKLAGYRVRRSIIERDINEADRAARLQLDADRLDAKAADWERNPPHYTGIDAAQTRDEIQKAIMLIQ